MKNSITLVRHGETTGESSIRLNGITDVPLSDHGREQIRRAASVLQGTRWSRTIASSLVRSQQSLEILAGTTGDIVPGFREFDFGDWESLTWAEVAERDPGTYARSKLAERDFQFPGGESRAGFFQRVADTTVAELSEPAGHVLAALHKGVIKSALATLCGLNWEAYRALPCDLGSVHRLEWNGSGWTLTESNRVDHLGDTWLEDHPPAIAPARR